MKMRLNGQQVGSVRAANRAGRMLRQQRPDLRIPVTLCCYVAAEYSSLYAALEV